MKHLVSLIALSTLLSLCACSHRIVEVERVTHDSVFVQDERHDTLIWLDSVWQNVFVHGDTVFVECGRERIVYRPKLVREVRYVSHTDSVPYPVEVPAKLTRLQRLQMTAGKVAFTLLSFVFVIYILQLLVKRLHIK